MNYSISILLLLSISGSNPSVLTPDALHREVLEVMNHPQTEFSYTTGKIPGRLIKKAKQAEKRTCIYDGKYTMANPSENFRCCCRPASDQLLLTRRLVFIARLKNRYVLCYERGGRAHNLLICYTRVNVFQASYYNLSLHEIDIPQYHDLQEIKAALEENRYTILYNNGGETRHKCVPF